ncbi:uncharacterized protein LOC100836745 [Brachypodium distachyon]|uniref:Uncharacterized protein n=1 Tax=Brachypodium distachyon TaxID=15368 RepID=I1HVK6_BRADI|nr:uncharacterized protein LOC100836745 [Brachypodium distachyon]KQK11726.1 hypothetical protein BRADI_2g61930v3 [Brachypodium distachyon]|eukprot:XP_003565168.1 uncharacterized protein LOC100836745 [Brachypodium distachyon]
MGNVGSAPEEEGSKKAEAEGPPSTVRFFPAAAQHKARQAPPIKLEEEEGVAPPSAGADADAEETMAPRNLWQVYALGAFIILRWGWAKWKESKDRDDDSPDDQSPGMSS